MSDQQQTMQLTVRSIGSHQFDFPINENTAIELTIELRPLQFEALYRCFEDNISIELTVLDIRSLICGKLINIFSEKLNDDNLFKAIITISEINYFCFDTVASFSLDSQNGTEPESSLE